MISYGSGLRIVSYYMSKPLEYNILEQRIIEIYDEDTRRKDIETEKQVSKKLYELEIYPNLVGYKYIKRAIELLIKADLKEKNYRKNIYSILSEEDNNAPIFKIEKAINNAITTSWNKDKEKLLEIFPSKIYEKKNPSARVFLSTIAEEIINENKKEQG